MGEVYPCGAAGGFRACTPGAGDVAVIGSPAEAPGVSADLYQGGTPSADGPTVGASGTIVKEKEFMGEMVGWIAFVLDTGGNRIGIQQPGE